MLQSKLQIFYFFSGIFIVGAKRTAFGTFGGALKNVHQTQLQTTAAKAALESSGLKGDQVDTIVIGNVLSVSSQMCNKSK